MYTCIMCQKCFARNEMKGNVWNLFKVFLNVHVPHMLMIAYMPFEMSVCDSIMTVFTKNILQLYQWNMRVDLVKILIEKYLC